MMRMTRDEQIAAVMASPIPICPCCEHGMDPHGADLGPLRLVYNPDDLKEN